MVEGTPLERPELDSETFMNCVRNYKVLYDRTCRDFKILQKKNNAWKEISETLGITVEEAKTRYNTIRTNFSKYIKKQRSIRSGSGRDDVPEIKKDYEHLRWLLTDIKHRRSTTNFKLGKEIAMDEGTFSDEETIVVRDSPSRTEQEDENSDDNHILVEAGEPNTSVLSNSVGSQLDTMSPEHAPVDICPSSSSSSGPTPKKRKTSKIEERMPKKRPWSNAAGKVEGAGIDREFLTAVNSLKKAIVTVDSEKEGQSERDDDYYFCLSLVGQLKHLEPRCKSMAKLQIMKIFYDLEWSRMNGSQPLQTQAHQSSTHLHSMPQINHDYLLHSHQLTMTQPQNNVHMSYGTLNHHERDVQQTCIPAQAQDMNDGNTLTILH